MKTLIYIILILFSISLIFICFLWFIYHGSSHNIPVKTDWWLLSLTITNILIISILILVLKKISKRE